MKWFKHHSDEDREFLDLLQDELGHEGYSVYYQVVEALATAIEREIEAFQRGQADIVRPIMTVSCKWLQKRCRTSPELLKRLLAFCKEQGRWTTAKLGRDGTDVTVEMPKLLSDSDNYFTDSIRKACKARGLPVDKALSFLGDAPKTLGRDLGDAPKRLPTEKIRSDQTRQEGQDQSNKPKPAAPAPEDPDGVVEVPDSSPSRGHPTSLRVAVVAHPESASPKEAPCVGDPLERPHYALSMVLLLPLHLEPGLAGKYAACHPVRVIAAATRDALAKGRNPGGYVRTLLEHRWRTLSPISDTQAQQLRTQMASIDLDRSEQGQKILENARRYDSAPFRRRPGETEADFKARLLGVVGASPAGPVVKEARV